MRPFVAFALGGALAVVVAAGTLAQQPNFGCLANANCGQKGNSPSVGPRDYWQNWICSGCHVGTSTSYVPSPPERALLGVPARFWVMHAEAARDGETRARTARHSLLPASRIAPGFQRLISQQPPRQ